MSKNKSKNAQPWASDKGPAQVTNSTPTDDAVKGSAPDATGDAGDGEQKPDENLAPTDDAGAETPAPAPAKPAKVAKAIKPADEPKKGEAKGKIKPGDHMPLEVTNFVANGMSLSDAIALYNSKL